MHQTNDELDLEQKLFIHIMGASENPLYLIPSTMENCSVKRPYCSSLWAPVNININILTIKTRLMCTSALRLLALRGWRTLCVRLRLPSFACGHH